MDLTTFYALMSVTCFTLVGLWWTVVERHREWRTDPRRRRVAGGIYLSFLLPALMSMFAQINPANPLVWRTSFGVSALVGLVSSLRLLAADPGRTSGIFGRLRWLVPGLYALVLVLGVLPELARVLGASPLQVASVLLILLVIVAHGLTWEFLMEPDPATPESPPE